MTVRSAGAIIHRRIGASNLVRESGKVRIVYFYLTTTPLSSFVSLFFLPYAEDTCLGTVGECKEREKERGREWLNKIREHLKKLHKLEVFVAQ